MCFCRKLRKTEDSRGEDSKEHDVLNNGVVNILALRGNKEDELEDTGSDSYKYPDHNEHLVQCIVTPL